jgi:hypothetical protein
MDIKKFGDFINEDVKIPVVDVLIDEEGNVYNGVSSPLRKGNISQSSKKGKFWSDEKGEYIETSRVVIKSIIGSDSKPYPLGIDKNGYLVYPYDRIDEDGYVVINDNGLRIPMTNEIGKNINDIEWRAYIPVTTPDGKTINQKIDYSFLLPTTPTGWVNVKVDMEVLKRVRRYSLSLGDNNNGHESFLSKLTEMKEISSREPGKKHRGFSKGRTNIQKEMSVIILLHYINEIKDFFTPGSSGFLFESFLAGLIPNSKVIDDNGVADVVAGDLKYQIKLYSNVYNQVPVNMKGVNDYYIVAIKNPQDIEIFIVDNSNLATSVLKDVATVRKSKNEKPGETLFNIKSLRNNKNVKSFKIELSRLEEKIESIGEGLKSSLDSLYSELSNFQYNIETIITGINSKGQVIDGLEFKSLENASEQNVTIMRDKLTELIKSVNRREEKGQNRQPRPKPNQ